MNRLLTQGQAIQAPTTLSTVFFCGHVPVFSAGRDRPIPRRDLWKWGL